MNIQNNIYKSVALGTLIMASLATNGEENLDTIIVVGKPNTSIDVDTVGSVDILTQEELAYEHVDDTIEIFRKVPGVYVSRFNQGIINTNIAIRGFAGDGPTPHAKLLVDGIPSNFHNGYAELDQLFPIDIASITTFKGTSDPRYGTFNIAGNFNVTTRQDDAKQVELTLGSYNTKEIQAYAGSNSGGFKQSYSIGYRANEGYRDHTDLEKYALSGSWEWEIDETKSFRIIARNSGYEGDSPGYISEEQAKEDPTQSASFADQDGGDKEINHLSLHWNQLIGDNLKWSLKGYGQTFDRERWVRFLEAWSLQDRVDDQTHIGVISTLNWFISDQWQVDLGLDYEAQDVIEKRYSSIDNQRIRGNAFLDLDYTFNTLGTYVQLHHYPSEALRWNIALRADTLDGELTDKVNDIDKEMYDFGTIIQPKFNIVYAASDMTSLFANTGRSFQHPFGSSAYTDDDKNARDVSINDGWEIGTQISPSSIITARISYWQQLASNEFVTLSDGSQKNVGETKRNGIDLAVNGVLSDDWSYWGSFTVLDTEIVKSNATNSDTEGNELRSIPGYTASIGVNYQATPRLVVRTSVDSQGDYYSHENNDNGKYGDYTILNVSADYDTDWGVVKLQINNLTDEYYEYVYDFSDWTSEPTVVHSPGDGINGSISVSVDI
jgi:iron complex outermembrane receptor protein